jgi:drug/metabolite transporter (DMT)-like permease
MRPVKQSAVFRLALLALIWGSSFLWIKLADRGFAPVEVTFARLALGAATLFPVVAARREALPRSAPLWAQIALAALFANAIPYLLFAVAEQSVDTSTAGIINATTPLWTLTLAVAVQHQKSVTARQCAGLVAVAFGVQRGLGRRAGMPGRVDQLPNGTSALAFGPVVKAAGGGLVRTGGCGARCIGAGR